MLTHIVVSTALSTGVGAESVGASADWAGDEEPSVAVASGDDANGGGGGGGTETRAGSGGGAETRDGGGGGATTRPGTGGGAETRGGGGGGAETRGGGGGGAETRGGGGGGAEMRGGSGGGSDARGGSGRASEARGATAGADDARGGTGGADEAREDGEGAAATRGGDEGSFPSARTELCSLTFDGSMVAGARLGDVAGLIMFSLLMRANIPSSPILMRHGDDEPSWRSRRQALAMESKRKTSPRPAGVFRTGLNIHPQRPPRRQSSGFYLPRASNRLAEVDSALTRRPNH